MKAKRDSIYYDQLREYHWSVALSKTMTLLFVAAALVAVCSLPWVSQVSAPPVNTVSAACELATTTVSARGHFDTSRIAYCDPVVAEANPKGYFVIALHGQCNEGICGSTLIGWFAVQQSTGHIFEWDMGKDALGMPVTR